MTPAEQIDAVLNCGTAAEVLDNINELWNAHKEIQSHIVERDALHASFYRWLRDVGDAIWPRFTTRYMVHDADSCDWLIRNAIHRQQHKDHHEN